MPSTPSIFLVFIAGIVTVARLNIILLLLPAVMSVSVGAWFRPLVIVGGMIIGFTGTLIMLSGFDATFVIFMTRSLSILFILGMGTMLFAEDADMEFKKISSSIMDCLKSKSGFLNRHSSKMSGQGLFGSFFFGMSLGIAWIPFLGPILGGVLAYAASIGNVSYGAWLLFVYSLGFSIPMLFIAYLGNILFGHINWFVDRRNFFKTLSGLLLLVVGLMLLFNILLIRWLSPYFPYLPS
ncbi:MAG: hypothetical protein FIB08_17310 [Candidatus Methanoperedens sp.]|nr:hypothetical protein [Candidatus Methanoperedens sp.]